MNQKAIFPRYRLGKADYLLGGALFLFCYFAFFQSDIFVTGWNALNYLYGNPLDFYQNCKKIQGKGIIDMANYPPPIFLIFALWLYPFKLLGVIKSPFYFSIYLVYWLKAFTILMYILTGLLFYHATQLYRKKIGSLFNLEIVYLTISDFFAIWYFLCFFTLYRFFIF